MKNLYLTLFVTLFVFVSSNAQFYNWKFYQYDTLNNSNTPRITNDIIDSTSFVESTNNNFTIKGQPVKFVGFNLSANSNFPDASQAEKLAKKLSNMGVNLVRLHHIENSWSTNSLVEDGLPSHFMNPIMTDKLFYLISELKSKGIYISMSIHTSRKPNMFDNISNIDSIQNISSAIFFDEELNQWQRIFANELLTSVNPYTGKALNEDPVLALLTIENEKSIFKNWINQELVSISNNGQLTQTQTFTLDSLYNDYLNNMYPSNNELEYKWSTLGADTLYSIDFNSSSDLSNWIMQKNGLKGDLSLQTNALQVNIDSVSNIPWQIQWLLKNQTVETNNRYIIEFEAKSDSIRDIYFNINQFSAPYQWMHQTICNTDTTYQKFVITFDCNHTFINDTKYSFHSGGNTGSYFFKNFRIIKRNKTGLLPGEDLALNNIQRIKYDSISNFCVGRINTLTNFYAKLERDYFNDFKDYLKNNIQVKTLITGSNWTTHPVHLETNKEMDYVENHGYWDHPIFPNVLWDEQDWTIDNQSMIETNDLTTLNKLFNASSYTNKPYVISEYNHAFPNEYQVEMLPIIFGYSAMHEVNGLLLYDYNSTTDWTSDYTDRFFNLDMQHNIMSAFPIYAYAYRNNLLPTTSNNIELDYNTNDLYSITQDGLLWWENYAKLAPDYILNHTVKVSNIDTLTASSDYTNYPAQNLTNYSNNEQSIAWNAGSDFSINMPKIQSIVGNISGVSTNNLSLLYISDFSALTLLSLDSVAIDSCQTAILHLAGNQTNSNMTWNATNTSVNDNWGEAPSQLTTIEADFTVLSVYDSLEITPLDGDGNDIQSLVSSVIAENGEFDITIDQTNTPTPLYRLNFFNKAPAQIVAQITISPNPATSYIEVTSDNAILEKVELYNLAGHKVKRKKNIFSNYAKVKRLDRLTNGIYKAKIYTDLGIVERQVVIL